MRQEVSSRHYGLDGLRIATFTLLVFYHCALPFGPSAWLVKVAHPSALVDLFLVAVQAWRMPLLFAVSGYASWALFARSGGPGPFLRSRAARLLPPLLLGTLLLAAPETWIGLVENHGYARGFGYFWLHDWLSFEELAGVPLPNPEHLWFLAYLLTYTALLSAALAFAPAALRRRAGQAVEAASRNPRLLLLALAPLLVLRLALLFTVSEQRGLLHDWVSDVTFIPGFLFGFALAARPALWSVVRGAQGLARPAAIVALAVLLAVDYRYPDQAPHLAQASERSAQMVMAFAMIFVLFDFADRRLNRDWKGRRTLNEAVFPLYLVHQTIIVLLAWGLRDRGLPHGLLYATLVGATFAGAGLFYIAARRAGPLRPLLGLAPPRTPRTASTAPRPLPAV